MSDGSRNNDIPRLDDLAAEIYADGDPRQVAEDAGGDLKEICPLFEALRNVTERYQEAKLIGSGSSKEVYRVYDAQLGRHVALARLRNKFSRDYFDAFLREAHLSARLQHPSIIRVLGIGVGADERPFFTTEFKRGRSLRELLRSLASGDREALDGWPLRRRMIIFQRICEAVAYAHSRRVLHLDLKPENIQVGDFGEVQVCDWGLGVLMPGTDEESDMETLLDADLYGPLYDSVAGTPAYMAPEQRDKLRQKTVQMDVFALGRILEELATLKAPPGPTRSRAKLSRSLRAMIAKAADEVPADRYASADALRRDLELYLSDRSTAVEPRSFFHELRLFYRRNRAACLVALAILGMVSSIVAFFTIQLDRSRKLAEDSRIRAVANQRKTEEARNMYQQAHRDAEQRLNQYLEEKATSEERLASHGLEARHQVFFTTHPAMLEAGLIDLSLSYAKRQLDAVLSKNPPPRSGAWGQRFWLHFLEQDFAMSDFEGGWRALGQHRGSVPDLYDHARAYAPKLLPEGYLAAEDFAQLLLDLLRKAQPNQPRSSLTERMLFYDASRDRRSDADLELIYRAILRHINGDWSGQPLAIDSESGSIRLGGKNLVDLRFRTRHVDSSRRCILRILDPRRLDLRGTGISDLHELDGLELIELDLRGTRAKDLLPLATMRSLDRVLVEPGRFSAAERAVLPHVEVVEEIDP